MFDNESLLSVRGFPTATATGSDLAAIAAAAGVPRTRTVTTVEAFANAFGEAPAARDLTTIVAKVNAVGPAGFVTDLGLLENGSPSPEPCGRSRGHDWRSDGVE